MIKQFKMKLSPRKRGFHLITTEILDQLSDLPQSGLINLFMQHTSAGISLNENCDPTVRSDFEEAFNQLAPEGATYYQHTAEGPDDMPAHIKSILTGVSLTIPVINGELALGTWQGIYLCEFRNATQSRSLIATVYQ